MNAASLPDERALLLSFIDELAELAADLWCEGKLDHLLELEIDEEEP